MEIFKNINYKLLVIGIILGGLGGFLYYYFIGCKTGTCPIKSNPYIMTLYGALFGGVLFFKTKKHKDNN